MVEVLRVPSEQVCATIESNIVREVEPIGYEHFCAVLESGDHLGYHRTNSGLQIITLPRATLICDGEECTMVKVADADMETFFAAQLAAIDGAELLAA